MLAFAGFTPSSSFRAAAKAGAGPGTGGAGARGHGARDGWSDSPCEATPVPDRSPSAPSQRPGDPERSIFVRLREGGYRLRDHTLFHLYVSTSPCGDARLNSPYEVTAERKTTSSPVTRPPPAWDGFQAACADRAGAPGLGRWARVASEAPSSSLQNLSLSPGHRAGWPETRNKLSLPVPTALWGARSPHPGLRDGDQGDRSSSSLRLLCLPQWRLGRR